MRSADGRERLVDNGGQWAECDGCKMWNRKKDSTQRAKLFHNIKVISQNSLDNRCKKRRG
ncbi:MAG: hypothetical protein SOW25_03685 [Helicobacter sp.]|nr:hypothetical protein [Helicobacter sp.]